MAKHQIIYTSCMRGIDGVNDGQQVFSYDAGFKDTKSDEVRSLFTYQVPSLQPGMVMDEELAARQPASFTYRKLKSGSVSVTLNTYLGRDYMGSAGRFGNHLAHSIVCDFADLDLYPCELYGGASLRSSMEYEEVNNPEPPAYLPEPRLLRGNVVNPDTVAEFLDEGENLERFKQMTAAMLRFPAEKKRLVICDAPERMILWMAALHYALPLDIAKTVNLTTYAFDPELSPAQLCGVISQGSRYSCESYLASGHHYVFDFSADRFSTVKAEEEYLEFLDTAFSFSYESLKEFHGFLMEKTAYRAAGEEIYGAYDLYCLLKDGLDGFSLEKMERICAFAMEYGREEVKKSVCEITRQYLFDLLFHSLEEESMDGEAFRERYGRLLKLADAIKMNLPGETMEGEKKGFLREVLSQNPDGWKRLFVTEIAASYAEKFLGPFKGDGAGLVKAYDQLEEYLADMPLGAAEKEKRQRLFYKLAFGLPEEELNRVNEVYLQQNRIDLIYSLYEAKRQDGAGLSPEKQAACEEKILGFAMERKITEDYVRHLMKQAVSRIPLRKPENRTETFLKELISYQQEVFGNKLSGKLLLFAAGMEFEAAAGDEAVKTSAERVREVSEGPVDVSGLGDKELRTYFDWVFGRSLSEKLTADSLSSLYHLFKMRAEDASDFLDKCFGLYYGHGKNEENFAEYIRFLAAEGKSSQWEKTGKAICGLSRQRLAGLDEKMRDLLWKDAKALHAWEWIHDMAENTNPILNGLSGLFKRKKD